MKKYKLLNGVGYDEDFLIEGCIYNENYIISGDDYEIGQGTVEWIRESYPSDWELVENENLLNEDIQNLKLKILNKDHSFYLNYSERIKFKQICELLDIKINEGAFEYAENNYKDKYLYSIFDSNTMNLYESYNNQFKFTYDQLISGFEKYKK